MKGVFWNSDGFKHPKEHKFISDLTKEQQLDFIALPETVKRDFTSSALKNLCGGKDFLWHCKPPRGRSGGMLLRINLQTFEIGSIDEGDFYIKFHLCNKIDKFKWALVLVYGPAQNDLKEHFLSELVHMCSHETLPIIVGGDFNILRSPMEKNNDNFDNRWPFLFNAIIDGLSLKELSMFGKNYTWANNLSVPTYEKLDRVLMSTEWEQKFPLSTKFALNRDIFDHTLLLNTNSSSACNSQYNFKFELGWLLRDGFVDMVKEIWLSVDEGNTSLERRQAKIRRLRQFLRGWAKQTSGTYKKEKKALLEKLDLLDKKAESTLLTQEELNAKHYMRNRLACLLREEEIKWYQRAKTKDILEGDSNTKYFHLVANGKHRKTRIYQLQDGDHIINGDANLKAHITTYYKGLFGPPDESSLTLDESLIGDIPQVSSLENNALVNEFTEKEIKDAVFQMEHNKAPGPDGFPVEFYQVFWDVIKTDLVELFKDFHSGSLNLYSLNFGTIILLPKCKEAMKIQQYRPICLLNVSFKIFTKVATNRITGVAQKVISRTQTAFIPGRNIMEGVVILHETIHELHRKKK